MSNRFHYGLCPSCKKPRVLHSKDRHCPQSEFEDQIWRPLADLWYEIVNPTRDAFDNAVNGEKQARNRIRKRRSASMDYQNAISVASRAWGQYQEAIRVADRQLDPLARLIWGEHEDDQPLITYGIICGPYDFLKFTDEPMRLKDAAWKARLDEDDFVAIVEFCGLLNMAVV